MKTIPLFASILAAATLAGCVTTQPMQGPVYSEREARATNYNELATVVDVRPVIIQGEKSSAGTYAGAAMGTALGGLAGSKIGKGNGKTAATIFLAGVGGAAGAAAGEAAAAEMAKTQGVEVVVKRNDGRLQSVIQAVTNTERFAPGQTVRLLQAPGGWHVSPL